MLHNVSMHHRYDNDPYSYCPQNYVDQESATGVTAGAWRKDITENGAMQPINSITSNNQLKSAKKQELCSWNILVLMKGLYIGNWIWLDVPQITMIDYETCKMLV